MLPKLMKNLCLLSMCLLLASCAVSKLATTPTPLVSSWSVHRQESLGVEVRYPTGWQVDSTSAFVWFNDPKTGQSFNIVNASFGMKQPTDFLAHLSPPVEMTKTLNLDGQPALFVKLQAVPESEGYKSVVAVITPYGRELTIGNKTEPEIFEQALNSIRFFEPTNPP